MVQTSVCWGGGGGASQSVGGRKGASDLARVGRRVGRIPWFQHQDSLPHEREHPLAGGQSVPYSTGCLGCCHATAGRRQWPCVAIKGLITLPLHMPPRSLVAGTVLGRSDWRAVGAAPMAECSRIVPKLRQNGWGSPHPTLLAPGRTNCSRGASPMDTVLSHRRALALTARRSVAGAAAAAA